MAKSNPATAETPVANANAEAPKKPRRKPKRRPMFLHDLSFYDADGNNVSDMVADVKVGVATRDAASVLLFQRKNPGKPYIVLEPQTAGDDDDSGE